MRRSCSRFFVLTAVPVLLSAAFTGEVCAQEQPSMAGHVRPVPTSPSSQTQRQLPPSPQTQQQMPPSSQLPHQPGTPQHPTHPGTPQDLESLSQAESESHGGRAVPGPVGITLVNRLKTRIIVNGLMKHQRLGRNLAKPVQIAIEPGAVARPVFQFDDTRLLDENCQWIFSVAGQGLPPGKQISGLLQKSGRTIEITDASLGLSKHPGTPLRDLKPTRPDEERRLPPPDDKKKRIPSDEGKKPTGPDGDRNRLEQDLPGRPVPGPLSLAITNRLPRAIMISGLMKHKRRGINLAKPVQITIPPGATVRPSFQIDDTRLLDDDFQWRFSIAGQGLPPGREMSGMVKDGRSIEITEESLGVAKQPGTPDSEKRPGKPGDEQKRGEDERKKKPTEDQAQTLKGRPTPGPVTLILVNRLRTPITINGVMKHKGRGTDLAKPIRITIPPGATLRPAFQLDDTRLLDDQSEWTLSMVGQGLPSGKMISGMLQNGRTIEITYEKLGMQIPRR